MYKQLIEDISYDLNIQKYPSEKVKQYHSRIVYSAISLWMKYIILDNMIHEDEAEIKTKNYHYRRSKEVLEEYSNLFPEISYWMYPDMDKDPIHVLRNRLIAAGEINEIDLSGNITVAKKKIIPITANISRMIEISTSNTEFKYVGITKIINARNKQQPFLFTDNSLELVKEFLNPSFYYKIPKFEARYEVFNPLKGTKYEKHWIPNGRLNSDIHLIRKETQQVNYWDYLLVVNKSDGLYQYPLNEMLVNQGFHYRLILGLRQLYDNPLVAEYRIIQDIVDLRLEYNLPRYEESVLTTYSWPKNNILDSWSFIVPLELWDRVAEILKTLGYKLEEC
ncbi:hypothetical protein FPV24_05815 [Carnobacterium sp. PL24RED07]|uniref:hypothetical protein n=1 Tax=Lactobacillales TaxID=186826 RepID=UPI0011EF5C02|nr:MULTISPECIES: hypothetical protein [unclassified Carnobacterium]KAF3301029.1 hypothetical protein FPV22_05840 [Carnobacterium sp. PL26RED25]KAF3305407.1 hypothetical protein FPV24_05815 [Carnobacterium sp. PL24RED07]